MLNKILILFWQFTIKTISELDLLSNQNLSINVSNEVDIFVSVEKS